MLGGGPIMWRANIQKVVAGSSTEAELIQAYDGAKAALFLRSILWDLDVPQDAATILYEDNDAATAIANAGKPTPRARHMDIKYFALAEYVERDLVILDRIDTSQNLADALTKPLPRILFYRHRDFMMGHVPPKYSPKYNEVTGRFLSPPSPPLTAKAAKCLAPWDIVVASILSNDDIDFQSNALRSLNCGGVTEYTRLDDSVDGTDLPVTEPSVDVERNQHSLASSTNPVDVLEQCNT